ncbi:hypothetical protein GCM10022252_29070 [Streptosporangium oxazolinicum]|uniref:Uncharacterized protein n=1 Tax=Streptosporangium oxazolinicum TaxID=909287 RepID=A0ABP8AU45_9ACTN
MASATGLAGRTRDLVGDEERARVSVGKAVRRAVADPLLGEEPRLTIQTGRLCSYQPKQQHRPGASATPVSGHAGPG